MTVLSSVLLLLLLLVCGWHNQHYIADVSALAATKTIKTGRKLTSAYKFGSFRGLTRQSSSVDFQQKRMKSSDPKKDRIQFGTLETSSVGVGTISWFLQQNDANPELDAVMQEAQAQSADLFDTAERYGSSGFEAFGGDWGTGEKFIGRYVSLYRSAAGSSSSSSFKIATKFTPTPLRRDAQSVVTACEAARKRLGVDAIDLYQIHMPDIVQPLKIFGIRDEKDEKYWDGLIECYRRGIVKNVGVSNYGPSLLMRASDYMSRQGVPLVSNQINYSLLYRKQGAQETVDLGRAMGVQTLAYYPLAMGLLSGKHSQIFNPDLRSYQQSPASIATGSSSTSSSSSNRVKQLLGDSGKSQLELMELRGKRYEPVLPLLLVMQEIAARRGKSIAQIALNWCICKGALPIAGVRTVAQLRDNLGARGWRLSAQEVQLLEQTADGLGFSFEGAGFKRSSEKFVGYGLEKWSLN